MSIAPSVAVDTVKQSSMPISDGDTLYVGGKEFGNYSNIQDAIDNSSDGDIVFVYNYSSPYYENIVMDKSINLIGEDKDTTVIDGNNIGYAIYVTADWVNISGFTIRNTSDWFFDYGIDIRSNNCTVEDNNIISNNNAGLRLIDSNYNNILGNYFSQNYYSIRLQGSSNNTILNNTMAYEYCGIVATSGFNFNIISDNIFDNVEEISIYFGSNCNNNIIINNSLSDSKYGIQTYPSSYNNFSVNTINNCDIGLDLRGSIKSIVYGNWIMNCGFCGIYSGLSNFNRISGNYISNSGHGIYIDGKSDNYSIIDNTIADNIITLNSGHGIYLKDSSGYTISRNNINSNSVHGIYIENSLIYTSFGSISNNTLKSNQGHGIYLINSSSYTITNNSINSNSGHGIYLNGSYNNNTIIYNYVCSNNGYGVRLENNFTFSSNNIVYHNDFINNIFGGYDDYKNNKWDIGYYYGGNYWSNYHGSDDYRGPNQTTPGSDGIGDMPYYLDGGSNKDQYPLMYIWGEQRPVASFDYSIEYGGYIFNGLSSYDRDGIVLSYNWEFGDGSISQGAIATHGYNESGGYNVTLTVTDNDGYEGFYSRSIKAEKNYPPSIPSIDGPTKGKAGKKHLYNFTTEDQELADISYYVEWGDGKVTLWCGFLPSGETYSISHNWAKGNYTIRAKAKDVYGAESNWGTLTVTIPKSRAVNRPWLLRLFERFPLLERLLTFLYNMNSL